MPICYLCGQPVDSSLRTGDHAIPRTLLDNKKPKVRGFDYGGKLDTHAECNNRFGEETFVRKALDLLGALHDPDTTLKRSLPNNPSIRFLALNAEKLPRFGKRDFLFFCIHDAKGDDVASFSDRGYFENKPRVDPVKRPLFTALSVLAKSAAALLAGRKLETLPCRWNIVAIPYVDDFTQADFATVFGDTKPFGPGVRVWTKEVEPDLWLSLYVTRTAMVYFFFILDDESKAIEAIRSKFQDAQCFQFQGSSLMYLVGYNWRIV